MLLNPSDGPSPGRVGLGQFINNCKLPTVGRGASGPLPECIQGMDKAKPSGSHARPLVFAVSHPKDSRGQGLALGTSQSSRHWHVGNAGQMPRRPHDGQ